MTAALIFTLSLPGFTALALTMRRHHRDMFDATASSARMLWLHSIGWLLLAASVLCAVFDNAGVGIGLTLWFGMAPVTAMLVALGLTYLPSLRRVRSGSQPIHARNIDRHRVQARRQSRGAA